MYKTAGMLRNFIAYYNNAQKLVQADMTWNKIRDSTDAVWYKLSQMKFEVSAHCRSVSSDYAEKLTFLSRMTRTPTTRRKRKWARSLNSYTRRSRRSESFLIVRFGEKTYEIAPFYSSPGSANCRSERYLTTDSLHPLPT